MGSAASHEIYPFANENFDKMVAKPNENLMVATVTVQSQAELSKWASSLLRASKLKNHPILLPIEFTTTSRSPCGQQSQIQISYDCFYVNFANEIEMRRKTEHHFEEKELWYLLLTLVEAAEASHQLALSLGDIKPSNLLLNRQGQIKVLTKLSLPSFLDSYHREPPATSLLAPQELLSRQKGFQSNPNNYLIAESFAIGMIVLAAGTLTDASTLYDYQKNELNLLEFNKLIQYWLQFGFYSEALKAKTSYSSDLKALLLRLLHLQPDRRMRSLEANQILQNYRYEIMSLQKFTIDQRLLTQDQQPRSSHKINTQQLQSVRRRSGSRDSPNSSLFAPTFNSSHEASFQLPLNISSEVYGSSGKKNTSTSLSGKQKLYVTACLHQKQTSK